MSLMSPAPTSSAVTAPEQSTQEEVKRVDPLTSKFAMLSQKEKAYTRKMLDLKAREDAFKAKEDEYQNSYIPKKRFSEDPLSAMKEAGIDYNQMTELMLNQPPMGDPEIIKLQQKIMELEENQKKSKSQYEEGQTAAYKQAVNQIKSEVTKLVSQDSQYETIKETKSEEAVTELIEQHFHQTGLLLSVEAACKEVEDYLLEEAIKMASLNKVKAKLSPKQEESLENAVNKQVANKTVADPSMKTLTNAITQSSGTPMTAKQRRERAILAFQGRLTN